MCSSRSSSTFPDRSPDVAGGRRLSQRLVLAVKSGGQREGSVAGLARKSPAISTTMTCPCSYGRSLRAARSPQSPPARRASLRRRGSRVTIRCESAIRRSSARGVVQIGWLVAGESLADVERVRDSLVNAELIFGAVLLVLMYGASYVVAFAPFRRSPGHNVANVSSPRTLARAEDAAQRHRSRGVHRPKQRSRRAVVSIGARTNRG